MQGQNAIHPNEHAYTLVEKRKNIRLKNIQNNRLNIRTYLNIEYDCEDYRIFIELKLYNWNKIIIIQCALEV